MQLLVYIITFPIIWLFSILPFRVLYVISDGIFLLIYHIVKYRRKVVFENLSLSFPKKSNDELKRIEKKFYRHFVDIFIEMIKFFTISKKQLDKRYSYTNIDIFDDLYLQKKSVVILASHYANWEWIVGLSPYADFKKYAIFQKIENKHFNNAIKKSRERFGTILKTTYQTKKLIENNYKNNIPSIYGLASDQSPALHKAMHWQYFLGVYVPVHTGAEMLSKKYNMNVVYAATKKIKRGYYETSFHKMEIKNSNEQDFSLTDEYIKIIEKQIYEQPEYYFWTHKRFKHRKKNP